MPENDIQRIYDKLERIQGDIATIKTTVSALDNAKLMDRMTTLEQRQIMCPARQAYSKGAIANKLTFVAVVVSLVSVIIAWFKG